MDTAVAYQNEERRARGKTFRDTSAEGQEATVEEAGLKSRARTIGRNTFMASPLCR